MAGTNRSFSTGLERRDSLQLPMQMPDDEDEYALAAMGISDGFRPSNMSNSQTSNYQPSFQYPSPSHTLPSTRRTVTPPPRPSSATKPKQVDSFALQHDGVMGHVSGSSSTAGASSSNSTLTRSTSISTTSEVYIRAEEPYQGPTGPSHPYEMYNQESAARPISMATTVVRSERSYNGPTGPTHPYGMYPQNTAPESVSGRGVPPSAPIRVGFPGRNDNYQRRLGPDGEEIGDMIGPDGHTEQLPPYTKYPDEAFARKTQRSTGRGPIEGAGGIGLATRNPEFSSQEDLSSSPSRQSIYSVSTNGQASGASPNDVDPEPSEKDLKKWQKAARRKVCGIVPLWAIMLAIIVLVCFAIILGVTLYALKPKHRKPPFGDSGSFNAIVSGSLTRTFDASPFTTVPASLAALPTGTYALPISGPSAVQNSCLLNTEQSKGWSCMMPQSPLQMQILDLPGGRNPLANKEIILDYGSATFKEYPYGTQPPVLNNPRVLNLVTDQQDPDRGPAWFFQTIYNKIVVVPEDLLSSPFDQKRDLDSRNSAAHHHDELPDTDDFFFRRRVAQAGTTPWFCYWNGTLLEAFLFVNQTSSEAAHASAHATTPAATITSTRTKTSTYGYATVTSPANSTINSDSAGRWGIEHELLPAYPKVLKFQERRIPQGPQAIPPYCVKRFIAEDGTAQDMRNSTGQVIMIYLNETIPDTFNPMKRSILYGGESVVEAKVKERGEDNDGNCGCVWVAS